MDCSRQASQSFTISWSLLKLMSLESVMQPSHPLSSPLSSCLQSFPASGSFLMSRLFTSVGQSIGASASVFPMNIQDRFPLGLTGLISLLSSLQHHSSKPSILQHSAFFMVQLSHPHMTTEKNVVLTTRTFVGKVMSPLFNMLSSLLIAFLQRSKPSFNFMAAGTICSDFGAQENKVSHCFRCFPICLP